MTTFMKKYPQPSIQTIANLVGKKQLATGAAGGSQSGFSQTQSFKTLSAIEQISAKSTSLLQGNAGVVKPTVKRLKRPSVAEKA